MSGVQTRSGERNLGLGSITEPTRWRLATGQRRRLDPYKIPRRSPEENEPIDAGSHCGSLAESLGSR